MRVDHRTKTVHFGTELAEAQSVTEAEGPHLQDMPSEQVCTDFLDKCGLLKSLTPPQSSLT